MRSTTRAVTALAAAAALTIAASATPAVAGKKWKPHRSDDGVGLVFKVNPVQSSGDQELADDNDSRYAVPYSEYGGVRLTGLDGSGYLTSDYVTIKKAEGGLAYERDGRFLYGRADDRFEQVMAYFWINRAQEYLQELGFGRDLPGVAQEQVSVKVNLKKKDDSVFKEKKFLINFGSGGVDDAEDAEVIVHEYGHAVHESQVPGFGKGLDADTIGEGFADYFAVSVGLDAADDYRWPVRGDHPYEVERGWEAEACFADWDATAISPAPVKCLRRLDQSFTVADRVDDIYRDSMIWSGALWRIRQDYEAMGLGSAAWDTTLIASQFGYARNTSFAAAAQQTVDTAAQRDGGAAAAAVRAEFVERGILS